MGLTSLIVAAVALLVVVSYVEAAGECPLPSKVYSCSPKCVQDYECGNGKVCCANGCNAKSCTVPATAGTGTGGSSKYGTGGLGVICENVKCNPHEVCKMDTITKRKKCSRA